MPTCATTIGGPGAGKTTRALELIEKLVEYVGDPRLIGFVSFTRSARREAASRAAAKFGISLTELEQTGWFRTIHSCCYRILGIAKGELLTGSVDDQEWIQNALGTEIAIPELSENDDGLTYWATDSAGHSLQLWDVARNMQIPLATLWDARATVQKLPELNTVIEHVTLYEAAKRRDGRLDFCDLLMRFAGRTWNGEGYDHVEPEGLPPLLPVWMLDEAQDITLLTALVFKRLIQPARWAYLFGDDWQSIYQWAGCDGSIFTGWPHAKSEMLPISYRCGQNILDLGTKIMAGSSNYQKRNFRGKKEGGEIKSTDHYSALSSVIPGTDTLVLARTNDYARNASRILDEQLIPWKPIKGNGGCAAPARVSAVGCLLKLSHGARVTGHELHDLLKIIPLKINDRPLFERGIKTWFESAENRTNLHPVRLAEIDCVGGTDLFRQLIASGEWVKIIADKEPAAARLAAMARKHGLEAIQKPAVRVGTCHAAKGMEADHVVALTRLPYPTMLACKTEEGIDEERKVWYTTVTRARERLTIGEDAESGNSFSLR